MNIPKPSHTVTFHNYVTNSKTVHHVYSYEQAKIVFNELLKEVPTDWIFDKNSPDPISHFDYLYHLYEDGCLKIEVVK